MIDRAEYLLEVGARMWSPAVRLDRDGARGPHSFLLIPAAAKPQLVVPAGAPRAAAAAVAGFTGHRAGLAGLRSAVLCWGLRSGLGDRVLRGRLRAGPGPGIEDHLAPILGETPLVALHVGPPRANRKPVLQLLARDGRILGFAKVGTGALTDELVDREARALTRLFAVPPAGVVIPRVLHHGRWRDLNLLVQSPLPVRGARPPAPARLATAMVAVADSVPETSSGADFAGDLIAGLTNLGPAGRDLAGDLRVLGAVDPARRLRPGAWHGDWTPWNCAAGADGSLLLWDWERYQEGVPRGFDALHHHLQGRLGSGAVTADSATDLVSAAPALLRPFGGSPEQARLTAVLYLGEIARRYLTDGQTEAGNPRGNVAAWIVPAVHQQTERLTDQRS